MRGLVTACAAAALLSGAAAAQNTDSQRPVYLEAGVLVDDRENQVLFARENVRMQSGDRVLLADEIEYRPATGRVIARGNVRLFDGPGPAQTAERIELDEELSEGVAFGFTTLLENNGKAAAAVAVRRMDGSVELTDGYYTACELCQDGEGDPTWRLRAGRVVRDREDQMVYYRNVRLEVLGRPILYSPAFAHADPSTPRRSGFLMPVVDISDRLGFSYKQPYLWVISPYSDIVLSPRLMTQVNPALEADFRKRFYSGEIAAEGSITYERKFIDPDRIDDLPASDPRVFDDDGFFGDEEVQWHIFSEGRFDISNEWRWGFGVQAVSDDLYLRRYDFTETPDLGGGLYEVENRFLTSQVYVQGRGERYYADFASVHVNSLSENVDDDLIPTVAPIGRLMTEIPFPGWAGRVETEFNMAALTREDGDDYFRTSAEASWSRATILPLGFRVEPYALGRLDAYHVTETNMAGVAIDERNFFRELGAVGTDIAWPFARVADWGDTVIAPRAHIVAATGVDSDEVAPNEDSQAIDLDSTALFARNRAGGFDIWEEGARADLGLNLEIDTFNAYIPDLEVFGGRSLRLDDDIVFSDGTGLGEEESDWVAEMSVDLGFLDVAGRSRLDSDTGDLNRLDVFADMDVWRLRVAADYTRLSADAPGQRDREDVYIRGGFALTDELSVSAAIQHDIEDDITRRFDTALIYRDECTDFRIIYEEKNFDIGNLGSSKSIKFQVTLFTLGSTGSD